jgi:hypothetical protein
MRKLIAMIALLALVDGSAAIAQPAGPRNLAAPPSVNSDQQMLPEAPVGHRSKCFRRRRWDTASRVLTKCPRRKI